MKEFDNKIALITGGSKGIGYATAKKLSALGATVIITGRNVQDLESSSKKITQVGSECFFYVCELGKLSDIENLIKNVMEKFGHIDILVNNAAISFPKEVIEVSVEEFESTMFVNLLAPILLTKAFVPKMIENGHGKIVNVSSRAGTKAELKHTTYSASKAGLDLLTKTSALEFARKNIQVNGIAPTVILTGMAEKYWPPGRVTNQKLSKIPTGRFGLPEEVADVIVFLCSSGSSYLNGVILPIDGGESA
ncbi:MAG: hypothetical protein CL780_06725 [Chloroflexi bacterium]|nr:hypothetical protein [Chloroflexota bacterium]|tara:strand:+ start:2750 stop:3499 length:750 start_codon:yes stop_codon:yes gene_type:complete